MEINLVEVQQTDRALKAYSLDHRARQNRVNNLLITSSVRDRYSAGRRHIACSPHQQVHSYVHKTHAPLVPAPLSSPEKTDWRESAMKKNDFSEFASNLLIAGSVSLAFMPFLLGDRLILMVGGLMQQGGVMFDQVSNYVTWLVS